MCNVGKSVDSDSYNMLWTYCQGDDPKFSSNTPRRFCIFLFSSLKPASCEIETGITNKYNVFLALNQLGYIFTWLLVLTAALSSPLSVSVSEYSAPVQFRIVSALFVASLHSQPQTSQISSPSLQPGKEIAMELCFPEHLVLNVCHSDFRRFQLTSRCLVSSSDLLRARASMQLLKSFVLSASCTSTSCSSACFLAIIVFFRVFTPTSKSLLGVYRS